MSTRFRLPIAALLYGLVAGCGLSGTYPSLTPRPEELGQTAASPPGCGPGAAIGCGPSGTAATGQAAPPAPAPAAADPALRAQVDRLLGEAQAGETAFRSELPATERAVAAAGKAGSDSWAVAQTALSRLEAARTPTTAAAAELDALARTRAEAAAQADLDTINAAAEQIRALVAGQDQVLDRLSGALSKI